MSDQGHHENASRFHQGKLLFCCLLCFVSISTNICAAFQLSLVAHNLFCRFVYLKPIFFKSLWSTVFCPYGKYSLYISMYNYSMFTINRFSFLSSVSKFFMVTCFFSEYNRWMVRQMAHWSKSSTCIWYVTPCNAWQGTQILRRHLIFHTRSRFAIQ